MQRKALGKGLASLISTKTATKPKEETHKAARAAEQLTALRPSVDMVRSDHILANRQQPRATFSEEGLDELAQSIKKNGIIQPLIVTPTGLDSSRYELIAGERRLRASKMAGLDEVPVVIRHNVTPQELLELAIIENLQREDLNPVEEAKAIQSMVDQFEYSQDEVGDKLGKSRAYVSNSLRLLKLPKVVQEDLINGRMDTGHARAILALPNLQDQLTVREQILQSRLSVRKVEQMVQARLGKVPKKQQAADTTSDHMTPQMRYIVEEMMKKVGTKISLRPKTAKNGALVIEYYSLQDLDRIYRKLAT